MMKYFCGLFLVCYGSNIVSSQKIIGCYWGAWTSINQIDISLCTHAYFAFYIPDSSGGISTDSGLVSSFLALKSQKPSVKLMASIGGWNAGTASFSAIAASPFARSTFVSNCVALAASGFDGIDIDWEYPAPTQKASFVNLLTAVKNALNANGKILAAAVSSGSWQVSQSYNIPGVCSQLDLVNLMTYDMQWPYTTTGTNAGYSQVDNAVALWINRGCPSSKLVLGLASYGYDFTLNNPSSNGVGASATGATSIAYRDICKKLKASGWTAARAAQTPYAYKGTEWISYDDVASLTAKLKIVSVRSLAGAFFWSTNLDDYDNSCGTGKYPLISAVFAAFDVSSKDVLTTTNPTTLPVTKTTTTKFTTQTVTKKIKSPTTKSPTTIGGDISCSADGFYEYPGDCKRFYRCVFGTTYIFSCSEGTGWSQAITTCDFKANIPGCV